MHYASRNMPTDFLYHPNLVQRFKLLRSVCPSGGLPWLRLWKPSPPIPSCNASDRPRDPGSGSVATSDPQVLDALEEGENPPLATQDKSKNSGRGTSSSSLFPLNPVLWMDYHPYL
ncbi:hypothetical protein NE237_009859 [Protea cynaroides]|uniref:Uncharacterized protein n=1 Tax=Protea cynaroides TaxID=273540 RepID=A0A9Q0R117_9MAGN|nr:hypothetical protein NE237_009859 [Protea cynaroides]